MRFIRFLIARLLWDNHSMLTMSPLRAAVLCLFLGCAAQAAGPTAPPASERAPSPLLSGRTVADIWPVGEERVYGFYLRGERVGFQKAVRLPDDGGFVFRYESEAVIPGGSGAGDEPISTRMSARYTCDGAAQPLKYEAQLWIESVELGDSRVEHKKVTCVFSNGYVQTAVESDGRTMTSRERIRPYTYLVDFGLPAQVSLPVGLRDFDLYDSELAIFFSPQTGGIYSARVRVEERRVAASPDGSEKNAFLLSIDSTNFPRQYAVVDSRGVVYSYEAPSEETRAVLESIRTAEPSGRSAGAS